MKHKISQLALLALTLMLTGCSPIGMENRQNINVAAPSDVAEETAYEQESILSSNERTVISDDDNTVAPNDDTVVSEELQALQQQITDYTDTDYVVILNNNEPNFEGFNQSTAYEVYSDLDSLGRCGVAESYIGLETMPTDDREGIGQVKPTGWQTVKYDIVDGKYLYNRCHLIGFQLAGENANELNLITGTRYMNVDGMLPYENMVADYVKETKHHVMYRVAPLFEGDNLVATGVQMEAQSVEDDEIKFSVFCYNKQPGIEIDYTTGESWETGGERVDTNPLDDPIDESQYTDEEKGTQDYIVNTETKKFHNPDCSSAINTKEENKESFNGPRQWLIDNGYEPCGKCKP